MKDSRVRPLQLEEARVGRDRGERRGDAGGGRKELEDQKSRTTDSDHFGDGKRKTSLTKVITQVLSK